MAKKVVATLKQLWRSKNSPKVIRAIKPKAVIMSTKKTWYLKQR